MKIITVFIAALTFSSVVAAKFSPAPGRRAPSKPNPGRRAASPPNPAKRIRAQKRKAARQQKRRQKRRQRRQARRRKAMKQSESKNLKGLDATTTTSTTTAPPLQPAPTTPTFDAGRFIKLTPGTKSTEEPVQYACRFVNRWSGTRHPVDYPVDNAHWSPPVILTHDESFSIWKEGENASPGAQTLAETGNVGGVRLESELAGYSDMLIGVQQFNSDVNFQRVKGFVTASSSRPLLSTMSMIAPSPDWFTGISGFDLRNLETNTWYEKISIETLPYDAGTDSGKSYEAPDLETSLASPIIQFQRSSVPENGTFLNPNRNNVFPVARWECWVKL